MTRPPLYVFLVPLTVVVLAGCTARPNYPQLVPMQDILQDTAPVSADPGPDLHARASALDSRADALRRVTP